MSEKTLSCADCSVVNCATRRSSFPEFCLTVGLGEDKVQEILEKYKDPVDQKIAHEAAKIESDFYGSATRVEEALLFVKRMGYQKVGIASCAGLINECNLFAKVARAKGIDVYAVACKVGSVDKTEIGLLEENKNRPGSFEAMCNPILQAEALNEAGTDFNLIIGLCLGHDTLFIKHSKAPVSYLIVKDRVLCHNPAAALYQTGTYYARLLTPDLPKGRNET